MLKLILIVVSASIFVILLISIFIFLRRKLSKTKPRNDVEKPSPEKKQATAAAAEGEGLTTFEGGEDLTIEDILEAPGEVIGKSHYGTLYKASLQSIQRIRLLRFLRPATVEHSAGNGVVRFLGSIRHRNLVPLLGFYAGGRGEKLLIHPFYGRGNLAEFIRVGESESKNWEIIYKISLGIAKALNHLHTGLQKPVPHGNLKSKNILLDRNFDPHVSDFALHLLLNAAATREMLQVSAASGYKPPELVKMTDADERTDVFSYGKILLELLSAKEPTNRNAAAGGGDGGLLRIGEACCSSSPDLRPDFKEVIAKIEEIGRIEMD